MSLLLIANIGSNTKQVKTAAQPMAASPPPGEKVGRGAVCCLPIDQPLGSHTQPLEAGRRVCLEVTVPGAERPSECQQSSPGPNSTYPLVATEEGALGPQRADSKDFGGQWSRFG